MAVLSYDTALVEAGGVPALVNLVFGNVSMMPGVRLVDLAFPERLLATFDGPRHGVEGVRALTGVYGRPLIATALKPRGVPTDRHVAMGGRVRARAAATSSRTTRISSTTSRRSRTGSERCADAVDDANQHTGRRCLYLPHVTGPLPSLTPAVRVRGAARTSGRARMPVHRRARHGAIPSPATTT